jgi:3-hydroxyacyl-[acyl-carrier-protein] dehydratase
MRSLINKAMLKDDFYTVSDLNMEGNSINAILTLNENHPIFGGHFPGEPVVPGVCMMQMVKEITETALGLKLQIANASEVKFLMVINPNENRTLRMQLNYNESEHEALAVSAMLLKDSSVCFKFKGLLKPHQAKNY